MPKVPTIHRPIPITISLNDNSKPRHQPMSNGAAATKINRQQKKSSTIIEKKQKKNQTKRRGTVDLPSTLLRDDKKRDTPHDASSMATDDPPREDEMSKAACEVRRVASSFRDKNIPFNDTSISTMDGHPKERQDSSAPPPPPPKQQHRCSQALTYHSHRPPHQSFKQNQCGPPQTSGGRQNLGVCPPSNDFWSGKELKSKKLLSPKQQRHSPKRHHHDHEQHQQTHRRSNSNSSGMPSNPMFVDDHNMSRQGGSKNSQVRQGNKSSPNNSSHHAKPHNPKTQRKERKKKSKKRDSRGRRRRRTLSPHPVHGIVNPSLSANQVHKQSKEKQPSRHNTSHELEANASLNDKPSRTRSNAIQPSTRQRSIGRTNSKVFDDCPTKRPINSDTSIQKSVESEDYVVTIDPSEGPSPKEATKCTAHFRSHTAEEPYHPNEMMQTEFQKLLRAKENAEMKVQALEAELDIVRTQQERDAKHVHLTEEVGCWQRALQREKVRCEGLKESMQGEVDRLTVENTKLNLDWTRAMLGKNRLKERMDALKKKNQKLKNMLSKELSYHSHSTQHSGEEKYDQCNGGRDGYSASCAALKDTGSRGRSALEETSTHDDGSTTSFLSAPATTSSVSTASSLDSSRSISHRRRNRNLHRSSGPPSSASDSSHQQSLSSQQDTCHPQSVQMRRHCKDTRSHNRSISNSLQKAPASWHGGNSKKASTRRVPKIALPFKLMNGGAKTNSSNSLPPPARPKTRSSTKKSSRRSSISTSLSAFWDPVVSDPREDENEGTVLSGLRRSCHSLDRGVVSERYFETGEGNDIYADEKAKSDRW